MLLSMNFSFPETVTSIFSYTSIVHSWSINERKYVKKSFFYVIEYHTEREGTCFVVIVYL